MPEGPPGCNKNHGYPAAEEPRSKKMGEGEVDKLVERLHGTLTESFAGTAGEQATAEDVISKKNVSKADVGKITERLNKTYIKSQLVTEADQAKAEDILSKPLSDKDLENVTERLFTTHTISSSGEVGPPRPQSSKVSKQPATEEEAKEIYARLHTTHTVSSKGVGDIRHPKEPLKPPGYGQKMLPAIDGLETRFGGFDVPPEKEKEVIGRLVKTQTTASQARLDNPRILLYPERTTLMNNVDRIKAFQENGAVAKQTMLQRREKWYN